MNQLQQDAADRFESEVDLKFQLYNSLFLSLPFHGIEKTGALLALFSQACEAGFSRGQTAIEIVDTFFSENTTAVTEEERIDLMFRLVQYVERQVVLFDALEDASFRKLHDLNGPGTLNHLETEIARRGLPSSGSNFYDFCVRLVLTAHPTQFYPGSVLGIINDLADAIEENDVSQVRILLRQLGRTPFFKKEKPTPFDEAESLIWYLENVFYAAVGNAVSDFRVASDKRHDGALVRMGFWSGGDRDGNPFVTVETTRSVAAALRKAIFRCYHGEIRKLKRRLTFEGLEELIGSVEARIYHNAFSEDPQDPVTTDEIVDVLSNLATVLKKEHDCLFVEMVEEMIDKVAVFKTHFATLDIRQDSSVHEELFRAVSERSELLDESFFVLDEDSKISALLAIGKAEDDLSLGSDLLDDTLSNVLAVREIQEANGEQACNRYIISHTRTALHVIEVYGLFRLSGWEPEELSIDIVPLFETVEDLQNAASVMRKLYSLPEYRSHLARRGDTQTIMLGFSDGTKDGGYLMANYGIYRAKRELTEVSREFGVEAVFFDGRGGPPARGGGKTHRFYSSMGSEIANKEIQLTIQGQTVTSNFGSVDAAQYNLEQMIHAGVFRAVSGDDRTTFQGSEEELLRELADASFAAYSELKNDPAFLGYLQDVTPLSFYARTNIGSRPAKRGGASAVLSLDSLRAIPFVGAWSQIKQNVPGYYGVGSAFRSMDEAGRLGEVRRLYERNSFFKALLDNCEMALQKTFFPLTAHLASDRDYGTLWKNIKEEHDLLVGYLKEITGRETFMDRSPVARRSVILREKIVRPLATIQQYALNRLRDGTDRTDAYEKLIIRCSFGLINAGRNSA
ncbi:MAG: phosphoenolpyruvate carboxylase [Acidobacteria bacterium]|nr:MAG: phosphoenolpyruvate carboxylase [Acidobacteriota bacterium]REK04190.1 MAG: phosphoenolpyruvate carboxylase [Acidobacteriota bacterium]REK15352.1 MAG: phosphoenolpyruvate carboxylase [Acidobacteriota bacterium]REK46442.1 MAG: phosphoenolpyruvate carboxylase [Acidobacteriota bacterium]